MYRRALGEGCGGTAALGFLPTVKRRLDQAAMFESRVDFSESSLSYFFFIVFLQKRVNAVTRAEGAGLDS